MIVCHSTWRFISHPAVILISIYLRTVIFEMVLQRIRKGLPIEHVLAQGTSEGCVPPAHVMASTCCHCCHSIYILQSECVGLICANKPRWVWLASPPNVLIHAVVWQTAVYVNICAFTFLSQGEVERAGKQHTAAAGLMCTAEFLCVHFDACV